MLRQQYLKTWANSAVKFIFQKFSQHWHLTCLVVIKMINGISNVSVNGSRHLVKFRETNICQGPPGLLIKKVTNIRRKTECPQQLWVASGSPSLIIPVSVRALHNGSQRLLLTHPTGMDRLGEPRSDNSPAPLRISAWT